MDQTLIITKEVDDLINYFKRIWGDGHPIAKLFRTRNTGYLYDTGTNKVFGCREPEFNFLNKVLSLGIDEAVRSFVSDYGADRFIEAGTTIKSVIEQENILLSGGATKFGLGDHFADNLEEQVNSSLGILILEVTERCNLRCGYCVYNPQLKSTRKHGQKDMELAVAYQAIDYLKERSVKKKDVAISFYGGEPLLCFPFIKSCTKYARKTITDKLLRCSFTTNGVLLSPDMAQFFAHNNFNVLVSLDGPEEIHDRYRKDAKGRGSFKGAARALRYLVDAFGDLAKNRVGISMVYAPPYKEHGIERVAKIFEEFPWLPREMEVRIAYPHPGSLPKEMFSDTNFQESENLYDWGKNQFMENYGHKENLHPIARGIVEKEMAQFVQRPIYEKPIDEYYLNGCCVPGVRKIFVTTDGTILLCEKIYYDAPRLGNVSCGIDIGAVKRVFIDGYGKNSLPLCSNCWAIRLCNHCYIQSFSAGEFDLEKKKWYCRSTRFAKEKLLRTYCEFMEKDASGLDYLMEYELT